MEKEACQPWREGESVQGWDREENRKGLRRRSREARQCFIKHCRIPWCVLAQSNLTLCDPMDCGPPGFSVHGVLQARILEWVAISYSEDLPNPGIELVSLMSPVLAGRFFTISTTCEALV